MKQQILSAILFVLPLIAISQTDTYHDSFIENFSDTTFDYFRYGSTGNKTEFKYKLGVNSPTEEGTKILSFKIDPQDSAGAGRGPEIISKHFTHFGSYSARLKVPSVGEIQPNVGAVVGYFTYHMDSIHGLSEIDFEWLLADPTVIYVGTWTGHSGELKRIGRIINLAKGVIYSTVYREDHKDIRTALSGLQNQPETIEAIPDFDASAQFYTYGFDWHPDRIRWWMLNPESGEKIVLWDYKGSTRGIPQHRTYYRMNFWHTNNWSVETNPLSTEKPLQPYELEVDWMSYEPFISDSE
ncbi:glycoside hydrolase family 16 protein [Cyclobacterium jeungdonense]|uniref:Glycoside hydrolase family 16 protein n=1 Tax=Cyclobacterium jeungdonense TaxID=708087 RepID=A0ABT8CE55_9BACT|nr:glycoside hydrolase family 16 protein [Cyclobacterium jeungdonense]MDN3690239.1 glycoside hydrolase family 16 protein [Cyclobacterium jeungdonense]